MKFLIGLSIFVITVIGSNCAYASFLEITTEYNKGNLQGALHKANAHNQKAVHDFLLAQKYLHKTDNSSFDEVTTFLNSHPNFPQFKALAIAVENKISPTTSKTKIIKWFDHHHPQTPRGYFQYYQAAIARIKTEEKLNSIIKSAWINGSFSKEHSDQFLARHKKILTMQDHVDKISELLWASKIDEAKQFFSLVDKNYQQVFAVWINLLKNKNAEHDFHKIKGSYKYHSGLLYSYLKLHMKDTPNQELIALHMKAPRDAKHSKEWWKLKNYIARELLETKHYKEAYKIVSNHALTEASDCTEAEWFAGWLSLRYLKQASEAIKHFEAIHASSRTSISIARGAYWLGRSYKALNKTELANKWFGEAAKLGFTFYGQLAQHELGNKQLKLPIRSAITAQDKAHFKANPMAQIAEFLAETNHLELLKLYSKEAFNAAKTDGEVAYIYEKTSHKLNLNWKVEIAKLALHRGVFLPEAAFPMPYKAAKNSKDPALTYAIIRQETMFDQYAVSTANAQGLMQIMAPTGKALCKELNMKFDFKKLTSDANYNIKLGTYHLEQLISEFNGSYVTLATNYNAGSVAKKWDERFGKKDSMKIYDVLDWIESIPFYETRNYVQRVLENMQVYRYLISGNKKLLIKDDLLK